MPLSDEQLRAIKESCAAATPTCTRCGDTGRVTERSGRDYEADTAEERALTWCKKDCPRCGNFLKRARTDLPLLVEEVERLNVGLALYGSAAEELADLLRSHWKSPDQDAMTMFMLAIVGGIADAWAGNPPENGFVQQSIWPKIGPIEIQIRKVSGKSAAQSLVEVQAELTAARQQIEQAKDARGWQPIETASKDDTPILLWAPPWTHAKEGWWQPCINDVDDAGWTDGTVISWGYQESSVLHPTHWRPLPDPPSL